MTYYIRSTSEDVASSPEKSLLIFYISFSWSIALLIFLLESSKARLLGEYKRGVLVLKLGVYSLLALVLAVLTSPWFSLTVVNEAIEIIVIGTIYACIAGYVYEQVTEKYLQP